QESASGIRIREFHVRPVKVVHAVGYRKGSLSFRTIIPDDRNVPRIVRGNNEKLIFTRMEKDVSLQVRLIRKRLGPEDIVLDQIQLQHEVILMKRASHSFDISTSGNLSEKVERTVRSVCAIETVRFTIIILLEVTQRHNMPGISPETEILRIALVG